MFVRAVGVKPLKNKLSAYRLSDAQIAEAVRRGLIQPARSPRAPLPKRRPVAPARAVLEELERDREER